MVARILPQMDAMYAGPRPRLLPSKAGKHLADSSRTSKNIKLWTEHLIIKIANAYNLIGDF